MKTLILAAVLSLATTSAFATCKSDSADKKLAGAAKTSHIKKCMEDGKSADAQEIRQHEQGKASGDNRQRYPRDMTRVGDRDHQDCDDIVNNCERCEKGAQPARNATPQQRKHAKRESGISPNRNAPAA